MKWIDNLIGRLYGSTAQENFLLRARLRSLEELLRKQNSLLAIQIKLIAYITPKEKLPPWLQINLLYGKAVTQEEDEDVLEELAQRDDADDGEAEEAEDDIDDADQPDIAEFVELIAEDVEEIRETIDTTLQPAMEGAEILLSDVNPALGEMAHEWIVRMDALCERLDELVASFEQLAEEAAQMEQESKPVDDDDDVVLGLG